MAASPHTTITVPNVRHTYAKVDKCIYCGRATSAQVALTKEHIIPESFGGNLILPKASCYRCMKPINKFETACFDGMIYYSRYHLGITGKSKFKRRDRLR